ncbi:MAG: N-acetylneuraminate synthase family protein, partial [Candidatus Aminicenantaceae bacterium]
AEIGNNHEGDFELAKQMIHQAAEAGADVVKFQTFRVSDFVTCSERERYNQLAKYEFSYDQFKELYTIATGEGLMFLSTPLDLKSVDALDGFVEAFKIASGDNTFWPLIAHVASKGKPVILSTGMAEDGEIAQALKVLKRHGKSEAIEDWVVLLHCVSCYPTPDDKVNLLSIDYLKDKFGLTVGYSDHTLGTTACIAAVARGARVIEKHFTYSKKDKDFMDHRISADPVEFKHIVEEIRLVETSLGEYKNEMMPCEEKVKDMARRSIAAKRFIEKGKMIEENDLTWLRPASGFRVGDENLVIGRRASRNIEKGEIIRAKDLEQN